MLLLLVASSASAETGPDWAELRAPTLQAWTAYERQVDSRHQAASATGSPFFALDAFGIRRLENGGNGGSVAMHRLDRPQPGGPLVSVPDGKIHHWVGAVFVPGVDRRETFSSTCREYAGRESEHYDDVVVIAADLARR